MKKILVLVLVGWVMGVEGQVTWQKTYKGDYGSCASYGQQTFDGGYIFTGWITTQWNGSDVYVVKTNSAGDTSWTKKIGLLSDEMGNCISQGPDKGYIAVGFTSSLGN